MDIYEMSPSDYSGVDELLDFSNHHDDVLCASSANDILHQHHNLTSSSIVNAYHYYGATNNDHNNKDAPPTNYHHHHHSTDFTDHLSVPSDDVAELEWLSNFVHDSFSNFPANNLAGTINYQPENTSLHSRSRTRAPTTPSPTPTICNTTKMKLEPYSPSPPATSSSESSETVRQCTHCASEKTPQWRTGPLGPKTLCNACGVRYKSGRLVPEYRPAASPTFVLTQHSNSHRKVMELRRQKEMMLRPQQSSPTAEYQIYGGGHHHHHHNRNNYEVC